MSFLARLFHPSLGPREPMSPALALVYTRTHPSPTRTRRFFR